MPYHPAPVPRDAGNMPAFLDRELHRLANSIAEMLQTAALRLVNGPTITSGTLTPEGAVTAPPGSLFLRTDGGATTTLYVKTSGTGNTGWTAK